jgi:ubiquitin C-terminal hydrolase
MNNNGLSGLLNLGNTCYINTILQCLSHTNLFTNEILNDNKYLKIIEQNINNNNFKLLQKKENSLFINYYIIIKLLWNNCSIINPSNFCSLIFKLSNDLKRHQQGDAGEFFDFIINRIDEELSYQIDINKNNQNTNNIDSILKKRIDKSINYYTSCLKQNDIYVFSFIKQNFYGLKNTKVLCSECKTITESFEMFLSLQLHIEDEIDTISITDCLKNYIKKNILKNENSFYCKKCDKLVNRCYTWMKLWNTPNIMVIQLSRFINNNDITKKINNPVNINININIKTYIDSKYAKYLENNNTCFEYSLYASCCHTGSLNSGHYFAIINYNDNWYKIDDNNVYLLNDILSVYKLLNKYSYILFYKKNIL